MLALFPRFKLGVRDNTTPTIHNTPPQTTGSKLTIKVELEPYHKLTHTHTHHLENITKGATLDDMTDSIMLTNDSP